MLRKQKARPRIGKSLAKRHNVSLPAEVAERLRQIGGGNLSAGIRLALSAF